jgi:phosphoserine phosphatase RsbU/P
LKAIVSDFSNLSELGTKLNAVFCRDCIPSIFASLVLVEGEEESGTLRILNAGHIPPLRVANGAILATEKGGPALGLLPQGNFAEQLVELQTNEFLVVYSDGVTEAQNVAGEFFGDQSLRNLLPQLPGLTAAQIGERILSEVDRFVGDANVHDDLSVAILRRN